MAAAPALERMGAQLAAWEPALQPGHGPDRRVIFLGCYRLMTVNMQAALAAGEFHDARWVAALLERFADYYFDALAAYERAPAEAPAVWRLTFDAAREPATLVLQNLLLGVNAHICYDLVLTLVELLEPDWARLGDERRSRRYADHCHVNAVIARTVDAVQDTVVERFSPRLDLLDLALGPLDEWLASRLITHWREGVWRAAVHMVETPEAAEREALRREVEAAALRRAEGLLLH